jgi:hypothetical protein
MLPFVRDLISFEIRSIECFRGHLRSVIGSAGPEPHPVDRPNVQIILDSYEPIVGVLALADGLYGRLAKSANPQCCNGSRHAR